MTAAEWLTSAWLLQVTRLTLSYEVLYKFWHILKQLSKL